MTNPPTTGAGAGNTTSPRVYSMNQAVGKNPIHHFTSFRQQQVVPHHSYPNIAPRVPPPQRGMMYPLGSSGSRGFMPRVPYGNPARVPYGMHIIRPNHVQQQHSNNNLNHNLGVGAGVVRGIPVVSHPKVAASPSSISDRNGYKDTRDITRDDSFATVKDRKVKITDGASLYAQCRSWLRNGVPEESQPQYLDSVKSLPRPLPIPVGDAQSSKKEDSDKEEEDDRDVEQLSSKELLQTHIKRAKRVRARLREERLQRIARYKTRLALLLPPIGEQQIRNDTATGN